MKMRFTALMLLAALLTIVAATAYSPNLDSSYPTVSAYNRGNYGMRYSSPTTMVGYGSGFMVGTGGRFVQGYSPVDGYRLTQTGPYPYPRQANFMRSSDFPGHFDAWTGRYYDATTGRTVSQVPRQAGGVPARHTPGNPYIIKRYAYY